MDTPFSTDDDDVFSVLHTVATSSLPDTTPQRHRYLRSAMKTLIAIILGEEATDAYEAQTLYEPDYQALLEVASEWTCLMDRLGKDSEVFHRMCLKEAMQAVHGTGLDHLCETRLSPLERLHQNSIDAEPAST